MNYQRCVQALCNNPRWLALGMSFLPIVSLVITIVVTGEKPQNTEAVASGQAEAQQGPPLWVLAILLTLFVGKLAAIIGSFKGWYYGWVYHVLEQSVLIFLIGLFLVMGVLSIPLSLVGLIKMVVLIAVILLNFVLRSAWLDKHTKDRYHVAVMTHP